MTDPAKRGKDITKHKLLYSFEDAAQYDLTEFVEEGNLYSHLSKRSTIKTPSNTEGRGIS
jgi:hypothetical protein